MSIVERCRKCNVPISLNRFGLCKDCRIGKCRGCEGPMLMRADLGYCRRCNKKRLAHKQYGSEWTPSDFHPTRSLAAEKKY